MAHMGFHAMIRISLTCTGTCSSTNSFSLSEKVPRRILSFLLVMLQTQTHTPMLVRLRG